MMFQSLLHQGISLLGHFGGGRDALDDGVSIPSSSGHQFTALAADRPGGLLDDDVSIPSSSGHQFTEYWNEQALEAAKRVSIPSSSGHQFTARQKKDRYGHEFTVSIPSSSGHQFTGSGPIDGDADYEDVSIPSSSGHQFTAFHMQRFLQIMLTFQSLLHQGISLLEG